jgi:hypothetical protein
MGYIAVGVWLGDKLLRRGGVGASDKPYAPALLGTSLLMLVSLIHVIGLVVAWLGLGAASLAAWHAFRSPTCRQAVPIAAVQGPAAHVMAPAPDAGPPPRPDLEVPVQPQPGPVPAVAAATMAAQGAPPQYWTPAYGPLMQPRPDGTPPAPPSWPPVYAQPIQLLYWQPVFAQLVPGPLESASATNGQAQTTAALAAQPSGAGTPFEPAVPAPVVVVEGADSPTPDSLEVQPVAGTSETGQPDGAAEPPSQPLLAGQP